MERQNNVITVVAFIFLDSIKRQKLTIIETQLFNFKEWQISVLLQTKSKQLGEHETDQIPYIPQRPSACRI